MSLGVDYNKERRRAVVGIVSSAIVIALSVSLGLAGWFFFLDASAQAIRAQRNERRFDPQQEVGERQDAYSCWEMAALSEEFAVDFKETYHYYFAFDSSWNPVIVKMKGELDETFEPYLDAVYIEGAEFPEPFVLRGVTAPVEDDIREFAIESLNILFDGEVISEDTFEQLMGVSFLDTTRKPMGRGDFGAAKGFGLFGGIFGSIGIICLIINIKRHRNIGLAQQREEESLRQVAAWQDKDFGGYEDGRYSDAGVGTAAGALNGETRDNGFGYAGSAAEGYVNGSGVRLVPVRKSNMFLGILGAIGGSLLGVGLWLLISLVGFIAGFAGFVMLKCALKGYGKLSGRLDKKGAVISLVIAAFMVFFANVLEYVIALCRAFMQWDASFDTIRYVVMNFGRLMSETNSWGGFYMNLVIGYGLSVWSSYKVIWGILSFREP